MRKSGVVFIWILLVILWGCSQSRRFARIIGEDKVSILQTSEIERNPYGKISVANGEDIRRGGVVEADSAGESEPMILSAVVEDNEGGLVAKGKLSPVVVTANHKRVSVRGGKIRLGFDVHIPAAFCSEEWQVRLTPKLFWERDSMELERVMATGELYRSSQMRGYEKYRKFLSSIIPDSVDFVKAFTYLFLLENFSARNFKELAVTTGRPEGGAVRSREQAAGRTGKDGQKGSAGKDGQTGSEGKDGQKGSAGKDGPKGRTGNDGQKGSAGKENVNGNREEMNGAEGAAAEELAKSDARSNDIERDRSVSEEMVRVGEFGVTEDEAIEYYIKHYLVNLNNRRKARLEEVFRRCVKDPIDTSGIRLDTIIRGGEGDIIYRYSQDVKAADGMKKLRLTFSGGVFAYGRKLYDFPKSDTLAYYVSSFSRFLDESPLYLTARVERDVVVSTIAFIEFKVGSWTVDESLGENYREIERIKANFDSLQLNKEFVTDSVDIVSSCSPEGSYATNSRLSKKRAESVKEYFASYLKRGQKFFKTDNIPENWELLRRYILEDENIQFKQQLLEVLKTEDPDAREERLYKCKDYRYIRSSIYPILRRIDFSFHLHRKCYDTLTVEAPLDENYLKGLALLKERHYKDALEILRPYRNINTAICYLSLDYNASAIDVLKDLKQTPEVLYLQAVAMLRRDEKESAARLLMASIEADPDMSFKAALDPEMEPLMEEMGLL